MPSTTLDFSVQRYASTLGIPALVWHMLRQHPRDTNVILPHLEECHALERSGTSLPPQQFWISCTTFRRDADPCVDFVLSCTEGTSGSLPIFIVTSLRTSQLAAEPIHQRLRCLAFSLQTAIPVSRVFALFAPQPIAQVFAAIWTEFTGVALDRSPVYYAARITYCTRATYSDRHTPLAGFDCELRPARSSDLVPVAQLVHGFAAESPPYNLSQEDSIREAHSLIQKGAVWVHEIRTQEGPEIACIVAATRNTARVATITKVYTSHRWRKRGCAERLTRAVVAHLLISKDCVVLYVAENNSTAAKVYSRVGFVGLEEASISVEGVDRWLELGFDRAVVRLGHW